MSGWSDGYLTDLVYTSGFYHELMPGRIRLAALLHGVVPPELDRPFRYLELGCGRGMPALVVAATNPHAEVVAVDFNPAHIAWAQSLANEAGLTNIRLSDASFEAFADDPGTGAFDIIVLHGVLSWVGAENRAQLLRILSEKLVPGGFAMVSYNCAPGFAAFTPLQRLMTGVAAALGERPAVERMEAGMALAARLRDAGAAYFAAHPAVSARLDTLRVADRAYLGHEYFNQHWEPFNHPDVAAQMASAKLSYVGPMYLPDMIHGLNMTEAQQAVLQDFPPGPTREAVRDLLVNAQFRRDLFVRGAQPVAADQARAALLDMRFALTRTAASVDYKVTGMRGPADLRRDLCEPVVQALAAGPRSLRAMLDETPGLDLTGAVDGIRVFTGSATIEPCLAVASDTAASARLNRAILGRALWNADIQVLASPVIGGGVVADRVVQMILLARAEAAPDEAAWIWGRLRALGQRVVHDGKALEGEEASLAEIRRLIQIFDAERAPVLAGLGIV
jgi:SAM-dependent methyltransferase